MNEAASEKRKKLAEAAALAKAHWKDLVAARRAAYAARKEELKNRKPYYGMRVGSGGKCCGR